MDDASHATPESAISLPLPNGRKASPGALGAMDSRLRGISFAGARPSQTKRLPVARPTLERIAGREPASGAEVDFLHWLLSRSGLEASSYRMPPLLRRLPAFLRTLRVESLEAAAEMIRSHPLWIAKALDSLLIGTTEWFRDAAVFEQIQGRVLPELLSGNERLSVWSAGSSDGLELYSIAILLAQTGRLADAHLLGSDCRVAAIERAKAGVYVGRPLPTGLQGFHQVEPDGVVTVAPELRKAVCWELADVMSPVASRTWDLILCRNLAIYLEPAAVERLWHRLVDALHPGGYLVVGKAERPSLPGLIRVGPSIYRKCNPKISP